MKIHIYVTVSKRGPYGRHDWQKQKWMKCHNNNACAYWWQWTLMSYMVEGQGTTTYSKSKRWLYCYASESKRLLQRITDTVVEYLVLQVSAGAQVMLVHCFKNYQHFTFHFFVHDKQHSFACYNFCTMVPTHTHLRSKPVIWEATISLFLCTINSILLHVTIFVQWYPHTPV